MGEGGGGGGGGGRSSTDRFLSFPSQGFWTGRCWSINNSSQMMTCVDPEGDFNLVRHQVWNASADCSGPPSQTLFYSGGRGSCPATDFDSLGRKVYFSCHKPKSTAQFAVFTSFSGTPCQKRNFITARLSQSGLCLEDEDGSFYRHDCNATGTGYTAWEGCIDNTCTICERTAVPSVFHQCTRLGDRYDSAACLGLSSLPKAFFEANPTPTGSIAGGGGAGGGAGAAQPPPPQDDEEDDGAGIAASGDDGAQTTASVSEEVEEETSAEAISAAASSNRPAQQMAVAAAAAAIVCAAVWSGVGGL